jgi:hypothetical protein
MLQCDAGANFLLHEGNGFFNNLPLNGGYSKSQDNKDEQDDNGKRNITYDFSSLYEKLS